MGTCQRGVAGVMHREGKIGQEATARGQGLESSLRELADGDES